MLSDPIADFLIRIKNGYVASLKEVEAPYSKEKEAVAKVLKEHSFISAYENIQREGKKNLKVELLFSDKNRKKPALTFVKKVSKPGRRVYQKSTGLKKVLGGFGLLVVSTSKGVMSGKEARAKKLGGEIICEVW